MKTLAIYALEVLACSGVLLAAYTILLDRRVKFRWCRLYLLASEGPPVPACLDGRSRTDPPATHPRMAGAGHRGDPDRNCARPR